MAGPTILQRLAENPTPEGQEQEELEPEFDWQREQIQAPLSIRRSAEVAAAGGDVSGELEQRIQRSRGQGQEIAAPMRGRLEQAFGRDFGGVRIHANTEADQLNRAVQAKAFTTGNDIYFKQGEYQPNSPSGQELIAHELTHVLQQNADTSSLQRNLGDSTTPETRVAVADHSAQLSRGRNYILSISGSRYILLPLEPNGRTLYFFYGFEASTSDQSILESEAPFIEDDVIYAAEQGFTVVYDLEGTVADFAAAIFDSQAYGIYWSGHGNGHGNIVTSDGRGIGPGSVQSA
ncbi:MAG: DUF4157 domain-containing protein, partial [Leptolyngbya sp. RL_3_1]|nr:DUF4157 domain-containing protein [Leptolyngbya sp. RL_3_1]